MKFRNQVGSLLMALLVGTTLISVPKTVHAATPNPNFSWQDMTPNLPNDWIMEDYSTFLFDVSTKKVIERDNNLNGSTPDYYVVDPNTQTYSKLQTHTPSGVAQTLPIYYASHGLLGVSSGYVIDESTGQVVSTSSDPIIKKGGLSYFQDAAGNVYTVSSTGSGYVYSCKVMTVDPTTFTISSTPVTVPNVYEGNVNGVYGGFHLIPFSDGAGFWVMYSISSSSGMKWMVYNSATGITVDTSTVTPTILNDSGNTFAQQNVLTGINEVSGKPYLYSITSTGDLTETYMSYGGPFASDGSNTIPIDSNTVLGMGAGNFWAIPIDNPSAYYDTGNSFKPTGWYNGSNPPFDTTGARARAVLAGPNVYLVYSSSSFSYNKISNHVFALNAGFVTPPLLSSAQSTQNSLTFGVTNSAGITMGLDFQYTLSTTSGTVVSKTGWLSSSNVFNNLSPGTTYDLKVQVRNTLGQLSNVTDLGNFSTIPATPSKPSVTITGAGWQTVDGNDTLTLSYPPIVGATGYNVLLTDGTNVLKTFDVGNKTNPTITVPDATHNSGWVDSAGKYEVVLQSYNVSNGQVQASSSSLVTTLTPILQTDPDAPVWGTNSVILNGGQSYTQNPSIQVQINATDLKSGVSKILLSNDNISWTPFPIGTGAQGLTNLSNYTVTNNWQMPPGTGQKSVYVQLVDLVGNKSSIQTGYEGLQVTSVPPTVSLAINGGQQQTTSKTVTLTITAADPAYASNQLTMSFSNDGQTWTTPEAYTSTKSWTLPAIASGSYPVFVRVNDPAANTGLSYAQIYYLNQTSAPVVGGGTGTGGTIIGTYPAIPYNGLSNVYVVQSSQVKLDFSSYAGASYVSVSTDNISYSSLYQTTTPFSVSLPAGDGLKTVYAELASTNDKNALGNAGLIYFLVDATSPTMKASGSNGATATSGSSFNVQLDAGDNIATLTQMQYQVDGGAWKVIPANGIITISGFAPHSGRHTSTITVKDLAGNTNNAQISFWSL